MNKEEFHLIYSRLNLNIDLENYLFDIFKLVRENLKKRSLKHFEEDILIEYVFQEFFFFIDGYTLDNIDKLIEEKFFKDNLVATITDKFFFNEMNPYHAVNLISNQSPVISTMDLVLNFILNRISAIKKTYQTKNILLDMMSKVFLMFKSVNYLLSSGSETEAFATWRTIHELECVIKVIYDNPNVIPVYEQHIVYNNAFRDDFDDKEVQQIIFDDLKFHLKEHNLKSKDIKKYIEYGWLYSLQGIEEKIGGFKLNFRNGLEAAAGLSSYSNDYEMSSQVAHSSPLLIYSNKLFFKSISIVRNYESFLRLEEIFFNLLKEHNNVDYISYEKMRNLYLPLCKKVLNREISSLQKLIDKNLENKNLNDNKNYQ